MAEEKFLELSLTGESGLDLPFDTMDPATRRSHMGDQRIHAACSVVMGRWVERCLAQMHAISESFRMVGFCFMGNFTLSSNELDGMEGGTAFRIRPEKRFATHPSPKRNCHLVNSIASCKREDNIVANKCGINVWTARSFTSKGVKSGAAIIGLLSGPKPSSKIYEQPRFEFITSPVMLMIDFVTEQNAGHIKYQSPSIQLSQDLEVPA